jgi:hypothetical protein
MKKQSHESNLNITRTIFNKNNQSLKHLRVGDRYIVIEKLIGGSFG